MTDCLIDMIAVYLICDIFSTPMLEVNVIITMLLSDLLTIAVVIIDAFHMLQHASRNNKQEKLLNINYIFIILYLLYIHRNIAEKRKQNSKIYRPKTQN